MSLNDSDEFHTFASIFLRLSLECIRNSLLCVITSAKISCFYHLSAERRQKLSSVMLTDNFVIKNTQIDNTQITPKKALKRSDVLFKFSFAVRRSVGARPLTDIKALCPQVETHLWIGKGAVAQRPTGKGFCCTQTERKGEGRTEETKSITATFKTSQNFLPAHTAGLFISRSQSG